MRTVSITIPVYNVAPYLRRCLDSVRNQTFLDWEAICVDDGSVDGSGEILDEYARKDERFIVIHQENKGVNCARQKALSMSSGRWIAAVDADDWIDAGFLEGLVAAADESCVDMVWSDYYIDNNDCKSSFMNRSIQSSKDNAKDVLIKILDGDLFGAMWNRLLSRDFIKRHHISYFDGRVVAWEDLCFLVSFLSHNPSVKYVPECNYHYSIRQESSLRSPFTKDKLDSAIIAQNILEQLALPNEAKPILRRRRHEIKFNAYSSRYIAADVFYSLYPEILHIAHYCVPCYHKMLFWFAVRGYLNQTRLILRVIRGLRG